MQPNGQNSEAIDSTDLPVQSNTPKENSTPATRPLGGVIIQPLSSEDDIRGDIQISRSMTPTRQNTPPSTPAILSSMATTSPSILPLKTDLEISSSTPLPQKRSRKWSVFLILCFIIAALGFGIYYRLFFSGGKQQTVKLTETTVQQTTYLRPDGWETTSFDVGMETYSGINEEKQTIATITIEQSISSFRYYGSNRPDNFYEQARLIAEKNEKVASIIPLFKTDNQKCTSEIAYSLESDTKTANRTMGMTIATGTCTRSNEIYIVKRRTAIGENDGIYRHITVGARKDTWSKNEKLFQTILDSIGEVKEN